MQECPIAERKVRSNPGWTTGATAANVHVATP
jgi:hypothetical protein